MLVQEHVGRLKAPGSSLPGLLSGLNGVEKAFGGMSSDLANTHFTNAENAGDAKLAATELEQASSEIGRTRSQIEELVRQAATPLRGAREKAWELRTVCEGSRGKPTPDCKALIKAFPDTELATWSTKDGVDQAVAKVSRISVKDAARATEVATIKTKLAAAATGFAEINALTLDDAEAKVASHGDVATKAIVRIQKRCGEASKIAAPTDWVAAPPNTDPRKLTVLVYGVLPDSMRKVFDAEEKTKGDLSSGSTGSGVIVVRKVAGNGKPRAFVVTNRHVVDHSLKTKILLDGVEGMHDAQVVYLDPHHDLAVLEVARKADGSLPLQFESGVTLETNAAADQQTVVAAGYPGMGSKPSYQVTKGYVSNRRIQLEGDLAPYIQHTAPIDPGSSGGPLFSDAGRLLGVNTLKMRGREGVALAVPADVIADAVRAADAPAPKGANGKDDARLACLATLADVASSFDRSRETAARHLSATFVAEVGPPTWTRFSKALPANLQREAAQDFRRDSLGILYWAALTRLQQSLRASGGVSELEMCEGITMAEGEDPQARFIIQTVRGPRELKLMRERGLWTVASFDFRDVPVDPLPSKPTNKSAKPTKPNKATAPARERVSATLSAS